MENRVSQLYCCHSLLTSQDLCLMYRPWIRPTIEYGNILYFRAAISHLPLKSYGDFHNSMYLASIAKQTLEMKKTRIIFICRIMHCGVTMHNEFLDCFLEKYLRWLDISLQITCYSIVTRERSQCCLWAVP